MMTNKERYRKVIDKVVVSEMRPVEAEDMKINRGKRKNFHFQRMTRAAAVLLVLLVSGGGIAYAAAHHFGIWDFTRGSREAFPQQAVNLVETDIPQTRNAEEDSFFTATVLEALCDSESISVVYEVAATERGKYLFVPTDAVPKDHMSDWGGEDGVTAGHYAGEHQLEIVYIGGGISNREELGISVESLDFRSVSDDVMDIYVTCEREGGSGSFDVTCLATAVKASDRSLVKKQAIRFALEDKSNARLTSYVPPEAPGSDGPCEIYKADVIQTALRSYVNIYYLPGDKPRDSWFMSVADSNGKKINSLGGYTELNEDGSGRVRLILPLTTFGDHLKFSVLDEHKKEVLSETELILEETGS